MKLRHRLYAELDVFPSGNQRWMQIEVKNESVLGAVGTFHKTHSDWKKRSGQRKPVVLSVRFHHDLHTYVVFKGKKVCLRGGYGWNGGLCPAYYPGAKLFTLNQMQRRNPEFAAKMIQYNVKYALRLAHKRKWMTDPDQYIGCRNPRIGKGFVRAKECFMQPMSMF